MLVWWTAKRLGSLGHTHDQTALLLPALLSTPPPPTSLYVVKPNPPVLRVLPAAAAVLPGVSQ